MSETPVPEETFEACRTACLACIGTCEKCLTCCVLESSVGLSRRQSIHSCRTCMEVCSTCARLCAAGSPFAADMAALCARVCRHHHRLLQKYPDDPECAACATACLACAEACEALQAA